MRWAVRGMRRLMDSQIHWSGRLDECLPERYRIDGNRDFIDQFIVSYLHSGLRVYDVGGGKNPLIDLSMKQRLGLEVVGLDIDAEELARAPLGAYDRTICADVSSYQGDGDADLVICQSLLEHVRDTARAFEGFVSILKPGGLALLFAPSRNALFARINMLLPQSAKRMVLHAVYPGSQRNQGFPAYYDRCTPGEIRALAEARDLSVDALRVYYRSAYFTFCLPLHVAWRGWVVLFRALAGEQAAESFSVALRKMS